MTDSKRLWRVGITVVVVVGVVVASWIVVPRFFGRRDRPQLSDPTGQPRQAEGRSVDETLSPGDWPRFRGLRGASVASDAAIPFEWSDTKNLRWQADLPGPGSSSPIVVGDRVFVTCYNGYGTDASDSDDVADLTRYLVCLNRSDGAILWTVDVPAVVPEDRFSGFLTEHGYASPTPVSDGQAVYAFFGKSGVFAYDLEGNPLWHTSVGTQSDGSRWGSAASPVLYNDLVIVNASSESRAISAFDKKTGSEVWKSEAASLDLTFGTPTPVDLPDGRVELALCVPGELWGLDPDAGTVNWYAGVPMTGNVSPSVAVHDGIVYATGGYQSKGTVAVKAGGQGDVRKTHLRWKVKASTYVPSPVWHEGHLYWVDDHGVAICLNAETGDEAYRERLRLRGRGGRPVYASPVLVGDKLIVVTRAAGTVILAARPEFEQIATNTLADQSDFNATPAVSGDQLFLRSNRALYCVSAETQTP